MLTLLTLIDEWKAVVPASLLSLSMVPFASISLALCPLHALNRPLYRRLDDALYSAYMRLCLFVFENVSSVQIVLYGDVDEVLSRNEKALVLSNHQSNVDWAVVNMLAARQTEEGAEKGLRVLVKSAIQAVPLFGWYIYQHGYIYVRRFGQFVSSPVKRQLAFLESLDAPCWLLIFPEGTRFRADKPHLLREANQFQIVTRHVLPPKVGGMQLALEEMPSLDAVYDLTIAYGQTRLPGHCGLAPQMFEFVCGRFEGKTLHVHIARHAAGSLPKDKTRLATWIVDTFTRKDQLLEEFAVNGCFPGGGREFKSLPLRKSLPPTLFFISLLAAPFFLPSVRHAYVLTCLSSPFLILWLKIRKCA